MKDKESGSCSFMVMVFVIIVILVPAIARAMEISFLYWVTLLQGLIK